MNDSAGWFLLLTAILFAVGLIMPGVLESTGSQVTTNNLVDISIPKPSLTWGPSMAISFFWYYGDLLWWANAIKIVINIFWIYLLVRLIPTIGGG